MVSGSVEPAGCYPPGKAGNGLVAVAEREVGRGQGGEDALLFAPGDGEELCECVSALARDRGRALAIGAAARATIEREDLTWGGNARRVLAAVEALP